jgi:hypothetical protein
MAAVFKLLLRVLQAGPSDRVVQCLFSLLRRYVVEYRRSVFNPLVDYCRALCVDVRESLFARLGCLMQPVLGLASMQLRTTCLAKRSFHVIVHHAATRLGAHGVEPHGSHL